MKTLHTSAPWRVDMKFKLMSADYHQIIAIDGPRTNAPGFSIAGCINIHDAKLIAAAPELLEALQDVLQHQLQLGGLHMDTYNKVVNAIKKATE